MIITIIVLLLILDTAFGNRILPSKTGVVETSRGHYVYKYHRIMGIPIRRWQLDDYGYRVMIDQWVRFGRAQAFNLETATRLAEIYSNRDTPERVEMKEVWSSRQKKAKSKEDTEVLELLGNAIRQDDEPEIIRLSSLLKNSK